MTVGKEVTVVKTKFKSLAITVLIKTSHSILGSDVQSIIIVGVFSNIGQR